MRGTWQTQTQWQPHHVLFGLTAIPEVAVWLRGERRCTVSQAASECIKSVQHQRAIWFQINRTTNENAFAEATQLRCKQQVLEVHHAAGCATWTHLRFTLTSGNISIAHHQRIALSLWAGFGFGVARCAHVCSMEDAW